MVSVMTLLFWSLCYLSHCAAFTCHQGGRTGHSNPGEQDGYVRSTSQTDCDSWLSALNAMTGTNFYCSHTGGAGAYYLREQNTDSNNMTCVLGVARLNAAIGNNVNFECISHVWSGTYYHYIGADDVSDCNTYLPSLNTCITTGSCQPSPSNPPPPPPLPPNDRYMCKDDAYQINFYHYLAVAETSTNSVLCNSAVASLTNSLGQSLTTPSCVSKGVNDNMMQFSLNSLCTPWVTALNTFITSSNQQFYCFNTCTAHSETGCWFIRFDCNTDTSCDNHPHQDTRCDTATDTLNAIMFPSPPAEPPLSPPPPPPTTFYIRGSRSQIVFGTNDECTLELASGATSLTSSCPINTPSSRRLEDASKDSDRIIQLEARIAQLERDEAEMKEQLKFLTTEVKMLKEQNRAP